jgi:hypothetical protein
METPERRNSWTGLPRLLIGSINMARKHKISIVAFLSRNGVHRSGASSSVYWRAGCVDWVVPLIPIFDRGNVEIRNLWRNVGGYRGMLGFIDHDLWLRRLATTCEDSLHIIGQFIARSVAKMHVGCSVLLLLCNTS